MVELICIPITAGNEKQALADIARAGRLGDAIELRLDYLKGKIDLPLLVKAAKKTRKKVVATNRPKREGGRFKGSEKDRVEVLKQAAKLGVNYIDLEFSTPKKLRASVLRARKKAKLIVSHHDFKRTPSLDELLKLYEKMARIKKADALKIVTKAVKDTDNLNTLLLIKRAQQDSRKIISFCIGEKGKPSRIICLAEGCLLTYAALGKGKESAPGQLTVEEIRKFMKPGVL